MKMIHQWWMVDGQHVLKGTILERLELFRKYPMDVNFSSECWFTSVQGGCQKHLKVGVQNLGQYTTEGSGINVRPKKWGEVDGRSYS